MDGCTKSKERLISWFVNDRVRNNFDLAYRIGSNTGVLSSVLLSVVGEIRVRTSHVMERITDSQIQIV
jgi:hypothetical protein